MNKQVYRHEEKFLLSFQEYVYLKNLLGGVLKQDAHAGEGGSYFIRSLYFDTLDNTDFYKKENGVEERRKIRLRLYGEDAGEVKLEIKNKTGAGIYKEGAILSREDAESLARGDMDVLLGVPSPTARRVYRFFKLGGYRPVVLIDYQREAFIVPVFTGRITFDRDIRAASGIHGLGAKKGEMSRLFQEPSVILEVKYNEMLPGHIRRLLGSGTGMPMAISKYCLCRKLVG